MLFCKNSDTPPEVLQPSIESWLITILENQNPVICIFEFFAGSCYTKGDRWTTLLDILEVVYMHRAAILRDGVQVQLYLNGYEPNERRQKKFSLLKDFCHRFIEEHRGLHYVLQLHYHNEECKSLFLRLIPYMESYPSFVFIDQECKGLLPYHYIRLPKELASANVAYSH